MHLVYGIRWRIVTSRHTCFLIYVLLLKISVKTSVVDNPVFGVIEIGEHSFAGVFTDI